jgi:hypothetical protein
MADTDSILNEFFSEHLALSATDIQKSVSSREWLIKRITDTIEQQDGPKLYSVEPIIYFGSFFKHTKVADVDEFDVLLVIDSNGGVFSEAGIQTGIGLGSEYPNKKYSSSLMRPDGTGLSPTRLLDWLQKTTSTAVGSFGVSRPRIDGQAVVVELSGQGLAVDLVPAGVFESTAYSNTELYNIPSGSSDGWTITNPKVDKKVFLEWAAQRPDLKNITRLIKLVRDVREIKVSSFAIECAVIEAAKTNQWVHSTTSNLMSVVDSFRRQVVAGVITDIAFPVRNVFRNKPEFERLAKALYEVAMSVVDVVNSTNYEQAKKQVFSVILDEQSSSNTAVNS